MLPLNGVLIDENGRLLGAQPQQPRPNGTTLFYTPNLGFVGQDDFDVQAQLVETTSGNIISTALATVTINVGTASASTQVTLEQNHPNPFNPSTTITFVVPEAGDASLVIYNMRGQLIQSLHSGPITAGNHSMVWDVKDTQGNLVPSGIYFYQLKAGDFRQVKKLTLLK